MTIAIDSTTGTVTMSTEEYHRLLAQKTTATSMAAQINAIKVARARLNAEISTARAMLPDEVDSEWHYSGSTRTLERFPEWAPLLKAIVEARE